ncbi:MAG: hypothetical protein KDD78_16730 [Caldilineaceae bacterium]|nr:hypothetical protein [Caldilineaceae bacterium]
MKKFVLLATLVFLGAVGWQIGSRLSSDAVGMGVGVLFGVMAGLPMALLVLASGRRRQEESGWSDDGRGGRVRQQQMLPYGGYPQQQPPVIVLAGGAAPQYQQPGPNQGMHPGMQGQYDMAHQRALPGPPQTIEGRQFRVVGEREELIEEW